MTARPEGRSPAAEAVSGAHLRQGTDAVATMLSAMLLFGVPAWAVSRVDGLAFVLPVGLVLGMAAAVALVWFRYGTERP